MILGLSDKWLRIKPVLIECQERSTPLPAKLSRDALVSEVVHATIVPCCPARTSFPHKLTTRQDWRYCPPHSFVEQSTCLSSIDYVDRWGTFACRFLSVLSGACQTGEVASTWRPPNSLDRVNNLRYSVVRPVLWISGAQSDGLMLLLALNYWLMESFFVSDIFLPDSQKRALRCRC